MTRQKNPERNAGSVVSARLGGRAMFAVFRNLLLFSLVNGDSWPENLERICIGRKLIAWTADSAGLFAYPECQEWRQAREAWQEVVAVDGRPLSEMLTFPDGRLPGGGCSLYLQIAHGIISPYRLKGNQAIANWGRVQREQWEAYEAELNARYLVYDLLDDLCRDSVPLWKKRQKLSLLLDLLGPEDYHAGRIPSPIP
jgi:hypothetical protein